jgi:glycosyltransferase involved in cell wall biosynthesis
MLPNKLLFLTLNTFSSTGGIEKVCRIAGKALHQIARDSGYAFDMYSMYDRQDQLIEKYVPNSVFKAFSGHRTKFVKASIQMGRKSNIVVLSHVNLLLVGFLIKALSPRTKIILIAHGIEVWKPFPAWKKWMLQKVDLILPVSEFTSQRMQQLYGLDKNKFAVINNCLDPFLQRNFKGNKGAALRKKYLFGNDDLVLFTLTRLKSSEQYKGYDKVMYALPALLEQHPTLKYLIAGKYDAAEKERLDRIIEKVGLQDKVIFAGFVTDEEIEDYFEAADLYIMPSTGEGFGIVFIEALFYGKPVIAGNVDGSVDALDKGRLGVLVNPGNQEEIVCAVKAILANKAAYLPHPSAVQAKFSFETYQTNLQQILQLKRRTNKERPAAV